MTTKVSTCLSAWNTKESSDGEVIGFADGSSGHISLQGMFISRL